VRERIVIKLVVPMPLARKRIEDLPGSANSTLVDGTLAVPDPSANTDKVPVVSGALAVPDPSANTDKVPVVSGALAVPDASANTDTAPAKFSPKNAAGDKLITTAAYRRGGHGCCTFEKNKKW